jgi:hypothetical protein
MIMNIRVISGKITIDCPPVWLVRGSSSKLVKEIYYEYLAEKSGEGSRISIRMEYMNDGYYQNIVK